jgi:hypothetical protein
MAFELKTILVSMDLTSKTYVVQDASVWDDPNNQPDPNFPNRSDYGVFLEVFRDTSADPEYTTSEPNNIDQTVTNEWTVTSERDGKYDNTLYGFLEKTLITTPVEGDVGYNKQDNRLEEFVGGVWVEVELALAKDRAKLKGLVVYVPVLMFSENYQNRLNLEYITTFRNDVVNGAKQNKLYYKRSSLDYCTGLIRGAKYAWEIGVASTFINIVESLNTIILTDKVV